MLLIALLWNLFGLSDVDPALCIRHNKPCLVEEYEINMPATTLGFFEALFFDQCFDRRQPAYIGLSPAACVFMALFGLVRCGFLSSFHM